MLIIPAVSCGEFRGKLPLKGCSGFLLHKTPDLANDPEERAKLRHEPLEDGPTIIYTPTRKETLHISKFLSKFGIKVAAYNAKVIYIQSVEVIVLLSI